MKMTVLGANGRIGSIVAQLAIQDGLQVVAFVHGTTNLTASKNLQIINGDIHDLSAVTTAIQGSGAVVSALGSWGTPTKDILTAGMHNVIPAMHACGVRRIISLTGVDAKIAGEKATLLSQLTSTLLKTFAGQILRDGQDHIALLTDSNLDWTVIRSPIMNNTLDRSKSKGYRLTNVKPLPWATIHRNNVAQAMIDLLQDDNFVRQAPYITRS